LFEQRSEDNFQYLGFGVDQEGATIRQSSLAWDYRNAKLSMKRTKRFGEMGIAEGGPTESSLGYYLHFS
jgi:hypothetical protein